MHKTLFLCGVFGSFPVEFHWKWIFESIMNVWLVKQNYVVVVVGAQGLNKMWVI